MLIVAMNGQMLGLARLAYSLATNRQIPSAVGRLTRRRGTPYVAIAIAALLAFGFALPHDLSFLAGMFAFGAMITFAIAHLSVIVLRFREARPAERVPRAASIPVRGGRMPLPAAIGARVLAWRRGSAWSCCTRARASSAAPGCSSACSSTRSTAAARASRCASASRSPPRRSRRPPRPSTGASSCRSSGGLLDDDIVGTAGRLAAEHADEGEGGAVLEALYVFEIPMSLPIDARVSEERVEEAKRVLARAKEVGEEYEGVEVATAMVRGRTVGQAIVSEARRRGVEAIVLAAEEPTRVRGGAILGGRGRARDRFVGETTRYVVEKATCTVILTAPPAGEEARARAFCRNGALSSCARARPGRSDRDQSSQRQM